VQNEVSEVQCDQVNSTRDSKSGKHDVSLPNLPRVRKQLQVNGNNIRRRNTKRQVDWAQWWPFERATGQWLVALNKNQPKPIASTEYEDAPF
jgi:hypothetical protein